MSAAGKILPTNKCSTQKKKLSDYEANIFFTHFYTFLLPGESDLQRQSGCEAATQENAGIISKRTLINQVIIRVM